MKIAVFTGPSQLEFREIARPVPKPNQVLIKVRACTICTMEQRVWKGIEIKGLPFPFVMGHEVSGEVVQVGQDVLQDIKPGDRAVVGKSSSCGACYYCRRGRDKRCTYGRRIFSRYAAQYEGLPGMLWGFGEYIVMNEADLFVAEGVTPFEELAFGEPLSCVVHNIKRLNISLGDDVVVIGGGTMGLLNVMVANLNGGRTIVSELRPERLRKAREIGANAIVNAGAEDPMERVKALTGGRGADFVIAAFGSPQVNKQALEMLDSGGRFVLFAAAYPAEPLDLDPNMIHRKEIIISGSSGKNSEDLRVATKLLSVGMVNVRPLIERVLPFSQLPEALDIAARPDTYRVVVVMD